jgi:soluble lytic murein transglycosylase
MVDRLAELLVVRAPDLSPVDRARVASAIEDAAQAHQIDPLIVLAVIDQESGFDPRARGHGGSIGLMQVRPFVARDVAKRHGIPWKGARMLLDPAANVAIGACYLGEMFDMYSDPALAISAYNLGPYRVQRLVARGKSPRPQYLLSVLARYQVFSSQFGPIEPEDIEDAEAD